MPLRKLAKKQRDGDANGTLSCVVLHHLGAVNWKTYLRNVQFYLLLFTWNTDRLTKEQDQDGRDLFCVSKVIAENGLRRLLRLRSPLCGLTRHEG